VTLKLALSSSRPSVPYGASLLLHHPTALTVLAVW